jgi:hypothetical protein
MVFCKTARFAGDTLPSIMSHIHLLDALERSLLISNKQMTRARGNSLRRLLDTMPDRPP